MRVDLISLSSFISVRQIKEEYQVVLKDLMEAESSTVRLEAQHLLLLLLVMLLASGVVIFCCAGCSSSL